MKFILIIVIFILLNGFFIISNQNLHIYKTTDMNKFTSSYKNWIIKIANNTKQITSNVIKQDWKPQA